METRSPKKATEIAWEGIDMEQFNKDFRDFWSDKTKYGKLNPDKMIPFDESRDPEKLKANGKKSGQ